MSLPRVLAVGANYYVRGGSDRYFLEHERLLRRKGCEVVPFAASHPENEGSVFASYFPPAPDVDRPGALDALGYIFNSEARRSLQRLLNGHAFDIAHLQIYQGRLTSSILEPLRQAGIPIVQTLHDFKPICPAQGLQSNGHYCDACRGRAFWRVLARRCKEASIARSAVSMVEAYVARGLGFVDSVDRFISVCDFQRRKLIELGMPAERITTVHNFVDTAEVEPGTGAGDYFLYFGRLTRDKGLFTLLDAMADLPSERLRIAGRGPHREALERRAEALSLSNVEFVGFRRGEELKSLIRGSIATLLPAEALELCSLSVLESFALSRPVVATRIGGTPELVRDEVEGLLVSPGAADELADRMALLASNPSLATAMGRRARERALRDFSPDSHFQRILEVYQRAITGT